MLLGVDVGGTFTDAVLALGDRLVTAKAPTTPQDQSEGVLAAITVALERAGVEAADVASFSHGMTVATNALLEGNGARTALIVTEGFTDIVALGRQNRPELYRLCVARPAPLVPDELRFGAPERMTPEGPLKPLSPDDAGWLASQVREARDEPVEAVAVVLLHSYRHPEHEQLLGEVLAREVPGCPRLALSRGRRDVPRVRTGRDHRGRRGALAVARAVPAAARRALRRGRPPGARDHAVQRRPHRSQRRGEPRRLDGALRSGGRGRRGGSRRAGGRAAQRAVLRHGRHVVRRVRRRRRHGAGAQRRRDRGPSARAADARGPHRRGRRRVDRVA